MLQKPLTALLTGLYAITDTALLPSDKLLLAVEQALRGGCKIVQYRDKHNSADAKNHTALQLLALCKQYNAVLLINDDVTLAKQIGAHGVHLGDDDMPVHIARAMLGSNAIIGATCHASLALATHAVEAGADYLAFGRFFPSHTKPDASAAPLAILREARAHFQLPLVAIGGITLDNAGEALAHGADMLAVVHDLFAAADITAQAQAYQQLFMSNQR